MENQLPWYELIRREREQRSWTQAEVAEKIGVGLKTVGRWERGESFPLPLHRRSLATIYEKSLHELKLDEASGDKSDQDLPQQVDEEVIEIGNFVEKGNQFPEITVIPSGTGPLLRFVVQINLQVPKTISSS
jgi:transcriptional regulator with XRE-family HTH domain